MPGKNHIRVSSIILMILGVINIFLYLIAVVLLGSASIKTLIVLDVVGIMGAVSAVSGGQSVLSSLSSTITGMLFPLLYTYGVYLNETRG